MQSEKSESKAKFVKLASYDKKLLVQIKGISLEEKEPNEVHEVFFRLASQCEPEHS